MKKFLFIGLALIAGLQLSAQQLPMRSQYMLDYYLLNPAVAGSYDYIPLNVSVRQQWTGFNGAPSSQAVSGHGYVAKNLGVGGAFFNELAGPSRRTGFTATVAYHLPLSKDYSQKLSFGLSPVFYQHHIDTKILTTDQAGDPVITKGFKTKFSPDMNFGIMFSKDEKYFVGISGFNLFEVRTDLFQDMDGHNNPICRTFYFTGGYTFEAGEKFKIQPSTHLQYQMNTPFQGEFALRGIYNDLIGLGVSYRLDDAVAYMMTVDLGKIRVGYSYDMTMSHMKNFTTGSHEFHLTYRLPQKNAAAKSSKGVSSTPMFY